MDALPFPWSFLWKDGLSMGGANFNMVIVHMVLKDMAMSFLMLHIFLIGVGLECLQVQC